MKERPNIRILITAPGGDLGRRVLGELLAPEFSVRVILRDPAELPKDVRDEVEVVRGSSDDAATLRAALEGVDALFWCVPPVSWQERDVPGHYERFARAGCRAIREAGTPRVVTVSAGGKGLARGAGPLLGLHVMEDILNESGAAIRHLRCGWCMENFLRQVQSICEHGILSYPMPGDIPIPMVAAGDIVDAALRSLVRPNWIGIEGLALHGPEDLTYDQAAAVMERVLERPVRYRELSSNQYVRTLIGVGASAEYARSLAGMFVELAGGISRAEPRTAESTTPTTLAAWTESELLARVESLRSQSRTDGTPACHCHA